MSVLFIKINNFMCNNSFFSFMNEQKELLLQNGQFKTAVSYSCTLNSFFNFRRGKDLGIEEVFRTDTELSVLAETAWCGGKHLFFLYACIACCI